ncbi:hypothetical protein GQR58_027038 [Nymphon striatum]|nr:hypothetical protein GQR58_027038 [Nymphon striatum]
MLGESRGMPPGKFLISKNQHCETADNVDGHGNVKMQLEHRSKKSQREARRQSCLLLTWCVQTFASESLPHRAAGEGGKQCLRRKGFTSNRGIGALISIDLLLSSMDSDADETFFDAQDHAALYGKNELSSLKQKRPCSLGDVDMTGDSESDISKIVETFFLGGWVPFVVKISVTEVKGSIVESILLPEDEIRLQEIEKDIRNKFKWKWLDKQVTT